MAYDFLAPFTGSPIKDAAAQQQDYLKNLMAQQQSQITAAKQAGLQDLTAGSTGALGAIAGGTGQARTDIQTGMDPALKALYGGQDLGSLALTGSVTPAISALGGGTGAAMDAYNQLRGNVATPFEALNTQASQAQSDALGLNGPEGVARAQASFQAGPGFQFALGQGLDAITRAANATGMGASGNTLRAAQTYGQGLGQQEWDKYVANLQNRQQLYAPLLTSAEGTAAGGIANAALTGGTGAANIYTGTGTRLSDLYSGTGAKGAGLYTGAYGSLADIAKFGGLASANVYQDTAARQAALEQALTQTGLVTGTKLGEDISGAMGAAGAAGMAGATNLWNLGIGGAKLLAGGLGGLTGGGGGLTSPGGAFASGTNFGKAQYPAAQPGSYGFFG